jgi:hypothetical protein
LAQQFHDVLLLGNAAVSEQPAPKADALLGDDRLAVGEHFKLAGTAPLQARFQAEFLANEGGETRRLGLIASGGAMLDNNVHSRHFSSATRDETQTARLAT